jgi:hypothetical protein
VSEGRAKLIAWVKFLPTALVMPFVLTGFGLYGIIFVATGQSKHDTSGDAGLPAGIGLLALGAGVIGALVGGVAVSCFTGIPAIITVPATYYLTLFAGYLAIITYGMVTVGGDDHDREHS